MKVAGIHPVEELLKTSKTLEAAYIKRHYKTKALENIIKNLKDKGIPVHFVPKEKLDRLYKGNHQGIVIIASDLQYTPLEETVREAFRKTSYPVFLLLDGITDARNLGAIIRSAAAFEINGIIVPAHGSAPLNTDVIKISTGAAFSVPISRVNHLLDAIFYLKNYNVEIIAATGKTDNKLENFKFTKSVGLIMGNEQKGIQKHLLKNADTRLKIDISSKVESLNVSVATAIFLYEIHKQLITKK